MSIEIVLSFSGIRPRCRPLIARTLELVPFVCAGLLESCDIGVRRESASLLLRAHLSEAPGCADVIARLSSLVERANGVALRPVGDGSSGGAALLAAGKVTDRAIAPEALATALERALEALGGDRDDDPAAGVAVDVAADVPARAPHPLERVRYEAPDAAFVLAGAGEATVAVIPRAAPRPPPRVLLIDDLHERLATIADAIRGGGFDLTVVSAARGIPAAELISADLVLLTTGDPARAEAPLRTCRAAGPRDLRVLVVSAASPARDPHLLQAGADVIVSAALPPGELVDTARALLEDAIPPAAAPGATARRRPAGGRVAETGSPPNAAEGTHGAVEIVPRAT